MSKDTNIKWTESTWNTITGCSKISAGCKNCYALRDWEKLSKTEGSVYFGREFTDIMFHEERLDQNIRWKKPRKIFVNSMSDLFHEDLSYDDIDKVFLSMFVADWHTYQVLTKRPDVMADYLEKRMPILLEKMTHIEDFFTPEQVKLNPEIRNFDSSKVSIPFKHIWLGTSIEDKKSAEFRLPFMEKIKPFTEVAWISAEPLIEKFSIKGFEQFIDWFVLGGESGPNARVMNYNSVISFLNECKEANIAFLFKQWGEFAPINGEMIRVGVDVAGDLIDGINYAEYPKIQNTNVKIKI